MPYYIRYKVLEYEPNYKVEAYGKTLSEVFHTSAEAFLDHVILDMGCETTDKHIHKQFSYKSNNINDLLVNFLTEVKGLTYKNIVVKYINVNVNEIGYTASLTCRICKPELTCMIKTITTLVERKHDKYTAEVTFERI